jgi:hypothetical protein
MSARSAHDCSARSNAEVAEILDRLGSTADQWHSRLEKLRQGRFLGRFFATSRARLRQVAEKLGMRRLPNVTGCPTP